jgi:hypothetical protein
MSVCLIFTSSIPFLILKNVLVRTDNGTLPCSIIQVLFTTQPSLFPLVYSACGYILELFMYSLLYNQLS